jgi:hypothetical protein
MAFSFSKADPQESWVGDNLRPQPDARLMEFVAQVILGK